MIYYSNQLEIHKTDSKKIMENIKQHNSKRFIKFKKKTEI